MPTLYPAGGAVMPPSHAGMVPSLFAARSAPTGVSGVPVSPSFLTSSAGAFAIAPAENTAHAMNAASLV